MDTPCELVYLPTELGNALREGGVFLEQANLIGCELVAVYGSGLLMGLVPICLTGLRQQDQGRPAICEIDRRFVSYKRLFSLENQNDEASTVID